MLALRLKFAAIFSFMGLLSAPALVYAQGFNLILPPSAEQLAEVSAPVGSHNLPSGPFTDGSLTTQTIDGPLSRSAYRTVRGSDVTTASLMANLRDQAVLAGFDIGYECADVVCGGFDFRFGLDLLPEPDMHVDLGDYRYLLARRGDDRLAFLVSQSAKYGFVHITRVGEIAGAARMTVATKSPRIGDAN